MGVEGLTWDALYMLIAGDISLKSKDPRTKVGAVLVDDKHRLVSVGYNGFPRGVIDSPNVYEDKERKWLRVIHAETNALLFAKSQGHTMYCTHPPCAQCMAMMIQSGVHEVVWHPVSMITYLKSHAEGIEMGMEAGLKMFEWIGNERRQI